MFRSMTRRLFAVAIAAIALCVAAPAAKADPTTKSENFRLTDGDARTFSFTPLGAGPIKIQANYRGAGVIRKEIAIRMTLIKPDGTTKVAVGGSPLVLNYNLSPAEAAQFKGKAFQVKLENNVPQQDKDTVDGKLDMTFDDGKKVVLSVQNLDVGPQATQARDFTPPAVAGKVTVNISFRDGLANGKDMVAELVRVSDGKVLARTTGDSGLKLIANLAGNEGKLSVRMTNKQTLRTIRGIDLLGIFEAK